MAEYVNVERPFLEKLAQLGWRVIDERQAKMLELAELDREVKRQRARMKKLEAEL